MNVLIYLDDNLASSISLRYICKHSLLVPMSIQPFHVETKEQDHYPVGVGWVRKTWERTIQDTSRSIIEGFIKTEINNCRGLSAVKVVVGNVETEIVKEIKRGIYDLFAIGMLASFGFHSFYDFLKSELVQNVMVPVLLVKNITQYKNVYFLIDKYSDLELLVSNYANLYKHLPYKLTLLCYKYGCFEQNNNDFQINNVKDIFNSYGLDSPDVVEVEGTSQDVGHMLREGDMVVSLVDKKGPKTAITDILVHSPISSLIFWK
ncbi:hypothetical protein [Desulfonauticus submarinus]